MSLKDLERGDLVVTLTGKTRVGVFQNYISWNGLARVRFRQKAETYHPKLIKRISEEEAISLGYRKDLYLQQPLTSEKKLKLLESLIKDFQTTDFYWDKMPYVDENGKQQPGTMKNIVQLQEHAKRYDLSVKAAQERLLEPDIEVPSSNQKIDVKNT